MASIKKKRASLDYAPVETGEYDLVVCMHEPHVGVVMEYDDDDEENNIIVYADMFEPYASLPRKWFRAATDEEKTAHDNAYIEKQRKNGEQCTDRNGRLVAPGDEVLFTRDDGTCEWRAVQVIHYGTIMSREAGTGYRPLVGDTAVTSETRSAKGAS